MLDWVQDQDYPFYRLRPLDAPCLHILSADEPFRMDTIGAASRYGWRAFARAGIEEHYVAFDHNNILHEFNLPKIAEVLRRWCGAPSNGVK